MVRIDRILRDYREAGSVNGLLAVWGFVDDDAFLTKAGHLGVVWRVQGIDDEGLSRAQRRTLVHRLEAAVRLLDESCRLYQYLLKQTIDPISPAPCRQPVVHEAVQQRAAYLNSRRPELYELAIYFVLVYETPTSTRTSSRLQRLWSAPRRAAKEWLSTTATVTLLEAELERSIATLHDKARAFEVQLGDFGPERLAKADAFRFFRQLVNVNGAAAGVGGLQYDTHLDYFIGDSAIECHRDHLMVGDQLVKVMSMKEPPKRHDVRICLNSE